MTRLETLSPELTARLRLASVAEQRAASFAAAAFAVSHANLEQPVIQEALLALRDGGRLSPDTKAELESLVTRLDEQYFDLQEAAEEGRATPEEYLRVFGQARAISALPCAFQDDPFEAASEAIYEAAAVTDEPKNLFSAVEAVLDEKGGLGRARLL
jgi:hypothetical protein